MTRRSPALYDWSKLRFDETILRKHYTAPRRDKIRFVVVHHMAVVGNGKGAANDACYRIWQTRQASAHYGVDGDHVRQFVWDGNAAWSTGNTTGNHAGVSIEHANSSGGPRWQISEDTWKTGARLAAHLHHVYKLGRPVAGKTLRKHSSFASTACPGPFMDSIWSRYVAEAQRVYDQIAKTPKPNRVRWFEHRHLNTWGDDGDVGTRTLPDRLPRMIADLTDGSPEVITLNEVRAGQIPAWHKALAAEGYDVPLAEHGNLVAVPKGTRIRRANTYILPKRVQGAGRKEALGRVSAHINGHWVNIGVTHLDYRSGTHYDQLRVKQAVSCIRAMRRLALSTGIPTWRYRTTIGIDENSVAWVRDRAFLPRKWLVAIKVGIDAIYSRRKTLSSGEITTKSDHPIVAATYGKKA